MSPEMEPMIDRLNAALEGRYRIDRELGQGGMATVYLGEDLKHRRKVALKVLRPELALSTDRFLQEIRVTAGLQHPGIVPLFNSGEADGLLYYVMPFIEGESLRDRLDREEGLPLSETLEIGRSVASTLHYAHDRDLVHRDVKPSNILFSQGQPLVADFGIAKAVSAAESERLTRTGSSLGTPVYMSPEQATAEDSVDARADVYSLGCTLYEMISGEPPFNAPTFRAILARKLTEDPPEATGVPTAVAGLLIRAMAREPDDRFSTARELALALAEAASAARSREGAGSGATGGEPGPSIVVLPLRNLSPDPDNAFFADGLTEEIISDLARLENLRVISRTSAMRYRDSEAPLPEIARELDVHYVLEGSVRKAGQAIRVTAQLVEAVSDDSLWTEKFSGTLDDVFEIQERISREIVGALEVSLSRKDMERIEERRVEDPRVLELLMRVRYEIWRVTPEGFRRAEDLLAQADDLVDESPRLTAAKADLLFQSVNLGISDDESRVARAEDLARQAIDLDEDCAQAYSTLAWIVGSRRQQMYPALRYAERAYALDPGDSTAQVGLVAIAALLGHEPESDPGRLIERLLARDPFWPPVYVAPWMWETVRGNHAAALAGVARALELEPSPPYEAMRAMSLLELGRPEEAADHLKAFAEPAGAPNAWADLCRALYHAIRGDREAARAAITEEVVAWARPDCQYCWHVAQTYAVIGDRDEVIAWMERAVENQFWNWRFFGEHERLFDGLRDDPRYQALVDRAREAQEGLATSHPSDHGRSNP